MRTLLFLLALSACSLDPSTKPECVRDGDCYYGSGDRCRANVCVVDQVPVGAADVMYLPAGADLTVVTGDVRGNDSDPDGDPLSVVRVRGVQSSGLTTPISLTLPGTVTVDIGQVLSHLPVSVAYSYDEQSYVTADDTWYPITIARLPASLPVVVPPGGSFDVSTHLGSVPGITIASPEVVGPPALGALAGDLLSGTYTAGATCGDDTVTYRLHAANGAFDVRSTSMSGSRS